MKESTDNPLLYLVPKNELEKLIRIEDKLDRVLSLLGSQEKVARTLGEYVTEREAETQFGIKYGALYKLRVSGRLGYSKVGGKIFFKKDELKRLLDKNYYKSFK